jgi:Fe-S oxidoreductase
LKRKITGRYENMTNNEKTFFAPGCALSLYKNYFPGIIYEVLKKNIKDLEILEKCCRNQPDFHDGSKVINICPGCDKRYRNNYRNIKSISLWEILAEYDYFSFPDYKGREMSIIDACPTRDQSRIHNAVRILINKMNIKLVEPRNTRNHSICCGDTFYGVLSPDVVKKQMKKRTDSMPKEDVIVYCVSCSKSVFIGGKKPFYLIDLLFGEETISGTLEPDEWHNELDKYIADH